MKSDNVIQFPNRMKGSVPKDSAEIQLNINMIKHNHINEALGTIIPLLFTNIELAGFDLGVGSEDDEDEDVNIKDGALIVESIRSLLCKLHGMNHPFQELSEKMFIENPKEGGLTLVNKISINLAKKGDSES